LDNKHAKQLEETRGGADAAKKELEQLQNEKRKHIIRVKQIGHSLNTDFTDFNWI
jgi:hypothetical protein